jgi:hypothetical protein
VDTGKPLYIFDAGDFDAKDRATAWWRLPHNYRYKPLTHRLAMRFGPARMRREIGNIQDVLVESGNAQWLTRAVITAAAQRLQAQMAVKRAPNVHDSPARADLARATQAVRRLVISP